MGVKDLTQLAQATDEPTETLEAFDGMTFGIDISQLAHKVLCGKAGADQYHGKPPVPIKALKDRIDDEVAKFEAYNIKLVAYFDGVDHPRKFVRKNREKEAATAQRQIEKYWRDGHIADWNELNKLKRRAGRVPAHMLADIRDYLWDKHGIESVGAPFEAEWQMAADEKLGIIGGLYCTDSDTQPLECEIVVNKLKWVVEELKDADGQVVSKKKVPRCSVLRRLEVRQRIQDKMADITSPMSTDALLAFCCFLGCDYIPRVVGNGKTSAAKLTNRWLAASPGPARLAILQEMNSTRDRKKMWTAGRGGVVRGFEKEFELARNLYKHCPAFRWHGNRIKIEPLNPLPAQARWGEVSGFEPLDLFNRNGVSMKDAYDMRGSCRHSLAMLEPLPKPPHPHDSTKVVEHGAVRDFDAVPPALTPDSQLLEWLWWRNVPMIKSSTHADLVSAVQKILDQEEATGTPRAIRSGDAPTHTRWVSWEQLKSPDSGGLSWSGAKSVLEFYRDGSTVDSTYIDETFGEGRNGVRRRAYLRYLSGHYDVSSWRVAKAKLIDTGENVMVVEMTCTPSMKSEGYCVRLVYSETGELLQNPSQCACPDGAFFCSHMLGVLLIVRTAQQQSSWSVEDLVGSMAEPIKTIQSIPIAVSFVARIVEGSEKRARKEVKKFGNVLAKEIPGYSKDDDGEVPDHVVEQQSRAEASTGNKSHDVCADIDNEVSISVERAKARSSSERA